MDQGSAEEIVGTINYYSPELLGYIQEAGVQPTELGLASDVFALGLIYSEYLTGAMPPFDAARYHEAAVAVRSGETLRTPRTGVLPALADLVDSMLLADPSTRPTISQVHTTLLGIRLSSKTTTTSATGAVPPAGDPAPSRGLRGRGLRINPPEPDKTTAKPATRLVGKLLSKLSPRPRA